jgi:hypothetical protein
MYMFDMKYTPHHARSLTAALTLFGSLITGANAAIDYSFDDRSIEFNGVTTTTGGILMSIVVDTDTPNLGSSFSSFDNFYAADVYFSSTGLGLTNEMVSSATFLYFGTSVFGFTDTASSSDFSTIFTAYGGPNLAFGSSFDLSTLTIPQGPVNSTGNELRTANDIIFANGDRITGGVTIANNSTATVSLSSVPEPSSTALLGLGGLALMLRRRR